MNVPGCTLGHLLGGQFLDHANRHAGKRFQLRAFESEVNLRLARLLEPLGPVWSDYGVDRKLPLGCRSSPPRLPVAIALSSKPAVAQPGISACVVGFAHQQIGFLDRAITGDLPSLVGLTIVSREPSVYSISS